MVSEYGITKEEVLEAARRVQTRQYDFTAKDVWYELRIAKKVGRYTTPTREKDMHFIAAVLLKNRAAITGGPIGKRRYRFYA